MAEEKNKQSMNKVFALLKLIDKDKRYDPEAYSFIMASLDFTMKRLKRKGHITGQELADGIKDYALDQFGPMARIVLEKWGIKSTNDFGEIVFNLIGSGLLGKTEEDHKEDFNNRYDFKEAFDKGCKYSLH
ncbi:MAG: Minf_1886 family protein [Candidatus Omnitrophota bacterium]